MALRSAVGVSFQIRGMFLTRAGVLAPFPPPLVPFELEGGPFPPPAALYGHRREFGPGNPVTERRDSAPAQSESAMRYYFNTQDGTTFHDTIGTELRDPAAARTEALRCSSDLLNGPRGPNF